MRYAIILFWFSLSLLFFCYLGYGLLLLFINAFRKKSRPLKALDYADMPAVTLIIAAYNEEKVLQGKIANTLAIEYPADKLQVIFVTDGSTDRSLEIVEQYPSFLCLHQPERQGKYAAIVRAMQAVKTPIVVFSDANSMLNKECIQKMVRHYADGKTGGVAGEKKISHSANNAAVGEAEGLYWQYESFMKKQDAALNTVVGAAGELFSIRTHLFEPVRDKIILDDFIISMNVCLKGYIIKYEPEAFAVESPSVSLKEEARRKIRISAGAYQSIGYLRSCLNVFAYPLLSFQYISRRFLRWVFCPFMLIFLLAANIYIVAAMHLNGFYHRFLYAQLFFYALAIVGGFLIRYGKKAGVLNVPFYFLFMNYCLLRGLFRFLSGQQSVLWERSVRQ
jgi:poly-beta-1,6-N-acetyl-D-glucosamine synthase